MTSETKQAELEHLERGDIPFEIRGRTVWVSADHIASRMRDDFEDRHGTSDEEEYD